MYLGGIYMREVFKKFWRYYLDNLVIAFVLMCLFVHLYFIYFFYKIGVRPFMILNIFSVLTYTSTLFFRGPNKFQNRLFVCNNELLYYALISSIVLSYKNGFFVYITTLPFVAFIEYASKKRRPAMAYSSIFGIILAIPVSILVGPYFAEYRTIMEPYNYFFLLVNLVLVMIHFPFTTLILLKQLDDVADEIKYKSEHDKLTGVRNRESFDQYIKAVERDEKLSGYIIMFDIDDFKTVNDQYGHDVGDIALKVIAHAAQTRVRTSDILVRWGGEEFVTLIEGIEAKQALEKAEDIRSAIENTPYHEGKHLTVSVGVAGFTSGSSIMDAIKHADDNLYKSKAAGKNRVTAD